MKIAYFDCSSGISGDMCLGALVDAGVSLRKMETGLKRLRIGGYRLEEKRVRRASIAATKVDVIIQKSKAGSRDSGARTWKDINSLIDKSSLPPHLKQTGLRIFRRLFEAEGRVHGRAFNKTHLHELSAIDCIVDVFGALIGLDLLGIGKVCSSPVNLGSGSVITEHGRLPVPAPATAEILKGIPVYSSGLPFELTTPTGAAILREISDCSGRMPLMEIQKIGYGAGQKDIRESPNALRILIGDDASESGPENSQKVTVIETNIDDMNPQLYEYVIERLFDAGAVDVYLTQIIMKKGRPGIILSVLCSGEKMKTLADILFRETTTIGLRFHEASRIVLERGMKEIKSDIGTIKFKVSKTPDGAAKFTPEYEDCKRISRKNRISLLEVMRRTAAMKP